MQPLIKVTLMLVGNQSLGKGHVQPCGWEQLGNTRTAQAWQALPVGSDDIIMETTVGTLTLTPSP